MTFKEIQELIKLVNKTDLAELKVKEENFELTLRTKHFSTKSAVLPAAAMPTVVQAPAVIEKSAPAPAPAAPAAAAEEKPVSTADNLLEIRSPIVGTFYRSSAPDKPPYVKVGDSVEVGSVVCIVEAMKLFNEIESEISGKIVQVMVEDASPVEYDQVLYLVEPT